MGTGHPFPDMSLRLILLIPLSRVLTYTRAFLHFYEQKIRLQFPQLPSIQRFCLGFNPLCAVPQGGQDTANLPSLYVDIDAIKAGTS
ncbi:hypothetical protein BGW80DRAFT_1390760 [Lactifluus volemus]|nr:hypothetical protein BGW80DRAFT_1390760 [Lactifluus volemus]